MNKHHIAVCGMPRAGTSLLYLMMSSTFAGYTFWHKEKQLKETIGKYNRQVTKCPKDVFEFRQWRVRYRYLDVVLCMRDPRSVMCSIHAHTEGQYKVGWRSRLRTGFDGIHGTQSGGAKDFMDAVVYVKEKYPKSPIVYYENLVTDPDKVGRNLASCLGVQIIGNFSNWNQQNAKLPDGIARALNGVRPVETGRIRSWRQHPERIKELMNANGEAIQSYLETWGYEDDRSWYDEL